MAERDNKETESNKKGVERLPTEGVEKMLQGIPPYLTGVPVVLKILCLILLLHLSLKSPLTTTIPSNKFINTLYQI